MDRILEKLTNIESRLYVIEENIELLKNNGETMNHHITFIENVYNNIKSPFYYLMNFISGKQLQVSYENPLKIK